MPFWERLYELCLKKGCKPNTVAKSIGLSTAIATKWKNGAIPNGEALAKIADYLDCSVDYLLGRTDYPDLVQVDEKGNLIIIEAMAPRAPEEKN